MNKVKGDAYERHVRDILIESGHSAWLWKDIPQCHLLLSNICDDLDLIRVYDANKKNGRVVNEDDNPLMDVGVDILAIMDGKYVYVQCKCGYENGVCMKDLSGFSLQIASNPHGKAIVYYTDKIGKIVERAVKRSIAPKIECIKIPFEFDETPKQIVPVTNPVKYELRDYQVKAVTDLTEHLKTNKKCILSLPCSCGKTIISYNVSLNYQYVFIIAPIKCYVSQNLNRFKEYSGNDDSTYILISSDGTRNVEQIIEKIGKQSNSSTGLNKRVIMSSTFDSVDVVNKIIEFIGDNYIIIVDEFHNLSKEDVGIYNDEIEHEPNEMNKLIVNSKKSLFVSATPRVYDIEGVDDASFNEQMFGKPVVTMSFKDAIGNKRIANYRIFIPSIGDNYDDLNKCIINEIGVEMVCDEIMAKCMFLMKGFRYNGNKKCIVYCRCIAEISKFEEICKKLDMYYALDLTYFSVYHGVKKRDEILKSFAECEGNSIIFSVRTLDECIDLPTCDSVFITYPSKAIIRNVQRVFRCTRLDGNNVGKVGCVYVYCNAYEEILEIFGSLKEYDVDFKEKVNVMNSRLGGVSVCKNDVVARNEKQLVEKYFVEVAEYKMERWFDILNRADEFIIKNNGRPVKTSKNPDDVRLCQWLYNQVTNYEKMQHCMNNENVKNAWLAFTQKHIEHFKDNVTIWYDTLKQVEEYTIKHNKLPTYSNATVKTLGTWVRTQIDNCKIKFNIMKNDDVRNTWLAFTQKYAKHFRDNVTIWYDTLKEVEEFINEHDETPKPYLTKGNVKRLGIWIACQNSNYERRKRIMKNDEIRKTWVDFKQKYIQHFIDDITAWNNSFNLVKEFMDKHNDRPTVRSPEQSIQKIGKWLDHQTANYNGNAQSMKNDDIRKTFEQLITEYPLSFPSCYKKMIASRQNNI